MGTMVALNALEVDCKRMQDLAVETADLEENLTTYKAKNGLTERPLVLAENTDDMHARLSVLRKQLLACNNKIAEIERMVEQLPDAENDLEEAEETLKGYKARYDLLTDTIEALKLHLSELRLAGMTLDDTLALCKTLYEEGLQ